MVHTPTEPPYYGPDRLILSIDLGNSFSSVTVTHLSFGCIPSKSIRTVASFPSFPTSTLTPPLPSRHPSAVYYDRDDQARAFGAECWTPLARERAKEEGWILVEAFKSQMAPAGGRAEGSGKKSSAPSVGGGSTKSDESSKSASLKRPGKDGNEDHWEVVERQPTPSAKKSKKTEVYSGPLLSTIYADSLKHIVACARAWFSETHPNGDSIFTKLWSTSTFILTHPADWGSNETTQLREAIERANLLPRGFKVGRLVFVKEPVAVVHFVRNFSEKADETWLKDGASFVVCDSAEHGTSLIGYKVDRSSATEQDSTPRLQVYELPSRLLVGALTVSQAFSALLTKRLAKSKFNKPPHLQVLHDEFESKVKTRYSGCASDAEDEFLLRVATEGNEKSSGIRGGCLVLSGQDVAEIFRPTVEAIVIRLSSILPRGNAKFIVLAGGFGESPYVQKRLKEVFKSSDVSLVVPQIPSLVAVALGSALFYVSKTFSAPRLTRYELGISTAVDWSSNWTKGSEREVFISVSGQRYILGKWTSIVKAGGKVEQNMRWEKVYNVKHALDSSDSSFSVQLYSFDPSAELPSDGWMTDLTGKPYSVFKPACTLTADLSSLIALSPIRGADSQYVQLDLRLVIYLGTSSLEARVAWKERGTEMMGPVSVIPMELW